MTRRTQELLKEAMGMPARDRATIAHRLILTLDGPPGRRSEADWKVEIDRRIEKFRSGKTKSVRWEALRDRLRRRARATA
jgi:putative addiction module component (TIGR02574 family)